MGEFVRTPDGLIHFEKRGGGPALTLLHPLGTSSWAWHMVIRPLNRRFTCYAFDMLGHGQSDKPSMDFTLSDYAQSLDHAMQELNIGNTHVMGNSVGAMLAVELAASFPNRVDRLVLVGTPVWDTRVAAQFLRDTEAGYDGDGIALPRTAEDLHADGQLTNPTSEVVEKYNALRAQSGVWFRKTMETLTWYDLVSRLHQVKASATLIVYSDRDSLIQGQDMLLYNISNASKTVLPGLAHIPRIDDAQAFVAAVLPFLESA